MSTATRGRQGTIEELETTGGAPAGMTRVIARGMADEWNAHYPPGTSVTAFHKGKNQKTRTEGVAFVYQGKPVVWVKGISGTTPLSNVTPRVPAMSEMSEEPNLNLAEYIKKAKEAQAADIKELKAKIKVTRKTKAISA